MGNKYEHERLLKRQQHMLRDELASSGCDKRNVCFFAGRFCDFKNDKL
jgi:hypothetical protein